MIDTLLVVLIVALAAFWVGRRFYAGFRRESACGCGCGGCKTANNCPDSVQDCDAERNSGAPR